MADHVRPAFTARIADRFRRILPLGYPLVAAAAILVVARVFYGEMLRQTGGEWSAPLDDVFIHFDYARSTARGHPFEWSEGNGYSSGNTSLTYPFVLAFGYWIGFRGASLMQWAALIACCSLLAFFIASAYLALQLPRPARWILPIAVLSLGALDWTLLSGMEVSFFLATWGVALVLTAQHASSPDPRRLSWVLGLAGILVVGTRPEGAASLAVLGITAGWLVYRSRRSLREAIATTARAGSPAIGLLAVQTLVNRALTGEAAPNGAIVKLAVNNPFMTREEKWNDYFFNLRYCLDRNIEHHFSDVTPYGWIPVILALVALTSKRTRASAVVLLASTVSFILLVAMNGQVRWQNERYTMPAVAWLLLAAGLGLGVLVTRGGNRLVHWITWPVRAALAIGLVALFARHQAPNMIDQVWFFGRACRNIRDQHLRAGQLLRKLNPSPRRVAVGDAGALMYASDLPGLDIIGLGGFHKLPFARASVHGLGATVELIERMSPADRPDVLAVYPGWWAELPLWFGRQIASVRVEGNVICGGEEKAIYRTDWHLLETGAHPATIAADESITDELDVGDLVSEGSHDYTFQGPRTGFVQMRILADPVVPSRDVFDAGRVLLPDHAEGFVLRAAASGRQSRIIVRTAPSGAGQVEVTVNGSPAGVLEIEPHDGWKELSVPMPTRFAQTDSLRITLTPRTMREWSDHHVWLVEKP